jgi:4-diphosphocytidyl-2-C-methyl-D-erythritol kinase
MLLKAPAKINLTLKILSKRTDGYHEIYSFMRAIRLFDEVEIALDTVERAVGAPSVRMPEIRVSADMSGVPDGSGNLAYRAAERAMSLWGGRASVCFRSIDITLKKQIPAAAGLAGGSTDAAAVLLGLAKELSPETGISEIAGAGTMIGADIPFCVYACAGANPALDYRGAVAAVAEGIGDRISPLSVCEGAKVLLVKPRIEVPTKEIYSLYDARKKPGSSLSDNDLETSCVEAFPIVGEALCTLKGLCEEERAGNVKVQLSGSGPTVFAYFEEAEDEAVSHVYMRAKTAFPNMFVCLTETLL